MASSAVFAGLIATGTVASAHVIVNTTPNPDHGVIGTKDLVLNDAANLSNTTTDRDVKFLLYGVSDSNCTGDPVFTDTVEVTKDGDSTVTTDKGFVPDHVGTYHWIAQILKDEEQGAVETASACGEPVTITKAQPSITTTPSEGGPVGTQLSDSATVTGEFKPGGQNVSFYLYGPDNPDCHSEPGWLEKWEVPLQSDGTASTTLDTTDPTFQAAAPGTYHWKSFLSADANNFSTSTSCGEPVTIGLAQPRITTTASNGGAAPITLTDSATVSGGANPTGTVTFTLFTTSDCSGPAIFTSKDNPLNNGAAMTATGFDATTAGTYNWVAKYSGDANNNSASSNCGDESVVVTKVTGGTQGTTDNGGTGAVKAANTGAGVSTEQLRLAIGLLVLGGGMVLAGTAELISRRRAVRE